MDLGGLELESLITVAQGWDECESWNLLKLVGLLMGVLIEGVCFLMLKLKLCGTCGVNIDGLFEMTCGFTIGGVGGDLAVVGVLLVGFDGRCFFFFFVLLRLYLLAIECAASCISGVEALSLTC